MWKNCLTCLNFLPPTAEFWHRDPGRTDGWDNKCKMCKAIKRKARYWGRRDDELEASKQWRIDNPDAVRASRMARRGRLADNGPHEVVSFERVYHRDAGICGLCNDPVQQDLPYPNPGYGTLDHIIPLSKGGLHTYDNVQLAHSWCNTKKGNRQ